LIAADQLWKKTFGDAQGTAPTIETLMQSHTPIDTQASPDMTKVLEGIFDGHNRMAPDGRKYPVAANYVSKSKLVPGDTLKLTITEAGQFLYKQIRQIPRRHIVGVVSYDNGRHIIFAEGKRFQVLYASVTFYKLEPGDEVAIMVPVGYDTEWATVDSVVARIAGAGSLNALRLHLAQEE
jgi:hypothetical protein